MIASCTAIAIVGAVAAAGVAARALPDGWELSWALRMLGAVTLVGVAPGLALLLAWRPRAAFGVGELLGFSVAVSFAVLQLLTVAALVVHWPMWVSIVALCALIAVHAAVAFRGNVAITVGGADAVLLSVLGILAIYLYVAGAPFHGGEDRIHVVLVQRLAHLDAPAIGNIYFSPEVIYTYPLPGTHYLMAMMSRVGDVEPLFLYHKLRAFWGVAAALLLFGCARLLAASSSAALASTLVATVLVFNGTFGPVPGMYWGQMAPFSHASDVAMGVLLPALLLVTLAYLAATEVREQRVFLAAALALTFMVTAVHPREIVQFLVYLGAFAVAMLLARGPRPLLRRTFLVIAGSLALVVMYQAWYAWAVPMTGELVSGHRQDLQALFGEQSWAALFGPPLPLLEKYMPAEGPLFLWWNPVVLAASPVALFALRRHPLAWLVGAGIAAYLLIIRFPAFAIPYTYATYFEILYTPVRNVVFFVHLLAGVCLYLLAARLAAWRLWAACIAAAAVGAGLVAAFYRVGPFAERYQTPFFHAVLAAYAVLLVVVAVRRLQPADVQWPESSPARTWMMLALMMVPIAGGTWVPGADAAPLSVAGRIRTPAGARAALHEEADSEHCPPPHALVDFVRANVPVDAIIAVDRREGCQPGLLMPQQVANWSGSMDGFVNPDRLFPRYYAHLRRARNAAADQPLFNDRETREERLAFVVDLGVTHVLVSPRTYAMMRSVLDRDPDAFKLLYDRDRWAVYQVTVYEVMRAQWKRP